jgi:hypothetical protein
MANFLYKLPDRSLQKLNRLFVAKIPPLLFNLMEMFIPVEKVLMVALVMEIPMISWASVLLLASEVSELFKFLVQLEMEATFWLSQPLVKFLVGVISYFSIFFIKTYFEKNKIKMFSFFQKGDGEHGKLGHGTTDRVRRPKLITGIKARGGKTIRDWHYVSAGFR